MGLLPQSKIMHVRLTDHSEMSGCVNVKYYLFPFMGSRCQYILFTEPQVMAMVLGKALGVSWVCPHKTLQRCQSCRL